MAAETGPGELSCAQCPNCTCKADNPLIKMRGSALFCVIQAGRQGPLLRRLIFKIPITIHHMRAPRAALSNAQFGRRRLRAGAPREFNMPNKMIIDASHPEETRVVVLRGNRVEEFDFESANRKQLRGNFYLAKVTRVEPSLQAAFIDYGGNRHGFLAFSEIHPDYYQIPVADRQALLEEEAQSQREEDEEAGGERRSRRHRYPLRRGVEARAEDGETLSEPVPMVESGAEGVGKKTPTTSLQKDLADTRAGVYEASPVAVSQELNSIVTISAATGERVEDLAADLLPESRETPPLAPTGTAVFDESAFIPILGDEHIAAADFRHDAEREERSVAEDAHEVTTLDGGSEEWVESDKHRTEEEGEPVEQIGGGALEWIPRKSQRLRPQN